MLDWSTCELEGIVWDEFSGNDDHIVPHPGGEQVDSTGQVDYHKRPRCQISYPFTSNSNSQYASKDALHTDDETSFATVMNQKTPMLEKASWSCTTEGVFPASCDPDSIKELPGLTADDTKLPGNCFSSNHMDSTSDEFCADDPILGYRSAATGSSLCHFPLGDISSTGSDLGFFANEHEDKDNGDLVYYGWPDIGNFEDIDRMFRSCDSTFGQGNTGHDDEWSCFSSSSHAVDGSEDVLKSGLKSSSSDSNELRSVSKHHKSANKYMVDNVTPLIKDSEENSALNDYKIDSRALDASEPATLGHSSYVSWSDANAQNRGQSTSIEQENVIIGEVQPNLPTVSRTNNGSVVMEDIGMRDAFTNQVSNQKYPAQIRDEVGAHSEFEGTGIELPAEGSSTLQQSSCMSYALSDVVSLEETSFGQLQNIMEQLDIRTKLCIRDSLYRLARSAEQRHNIGSLNGCSRNCSVKTEVLKTEESNKCTQFVDMETDTNPIDRSIAHLLFHRPSEVSTRSINDDFSQESHAMLHGTISIQPAMTEKLVSPEEIAGGAETELCTD